MCAEKSQKTFQTATTFVGFEPHIFNLFKEHDLVFCYKIYIKLVNIFEK